MAYTLSNALQNLYRKLGQSTTTTATSGTTSTTLDTKLVDRYDDDFCVNGSLIVVRDSAGASAAPEGEFGVITAYDSSSMQFTHSTLSAATASGDTFMFTTALFPLYDMIDIINQALRYIGKIPLVDTSLTTANLQTEYELPLVSTIPVRVEIQTITNDANDNEYVLVPNYSIVPATAGSKWTLVIPQYTSGSKIRVTYYDFHPTLSAYSSVISNALPTQLIDACAVAHAIQWYNRKSSGSEDFWKEAENQSWREVERETALRPIWRPKRAPNVIDFNAKSVEEDTVPDPV